MNRQTVIALGVALVLGLLAVYLANTFLLASERNQQQSGTTRVAVAAVPLAYGVELTPDKVRFAQFPNSSIPAGSFTSASELMPAGQRRIALMNIAANEPILASKVTGAGQNASIAALLPDGMRAATVRVDDVSGVAGFIQPNDSVDVLITRQLTGPNARQITDLLLQNTKVLAIDQKAQNPDGSPVVARSTTLQVTPLDAQKLALAQQAGTLNLVLRKPGAEQDSPYTSTVSNEDLRQGTYARRPSPLSSATAAPRVQRTAAPRRVVRRTAQSAPQSPSTRNVEVVRGTEGNSYDVGEYGS